MNWCCPLPRHAAAMGSALSQEGAEAAVTTQPTMADVIRERKKKAGGAALGTLRRRLAARRTSRQKQDRDCEHARFIRSVVSRWRLAEVFALCAELEAGAALRDLSAVAALSREPAAGLERDLATARRHGWQCDVQLAGQGYMLSAHRALLAARCQYFRDLLHTHHSSAWVVPLTGAGAALSRDEMETVVDALYGSCQLHDEWQCSETSEDGLHSLDRDRTECRCRASGSSTLQRLGAALGFSCDSLHRDMRYLLDSGEYADARLVFRLEAGPGAAAGFRALELPCHRLVLAARSRYFRTMLSRRGSSGSQCGAVLCVDPAVLPHRVARALLHAAYTDQVDLSLIAASPSPGSSAANSNTNTASSTVWPMVGSLSRCPRPAPRLDDAFTLYEIARFLEMPIVVQGCEDAIVAMLSPQTVGSVLRWAACSHASAWVQRQAMRYLTDNFPSCLSSGAALPPASVRSALASSALQASEGQALLALVRYIERTQPDQLSNATEPNVVWHTAHAGGGKGRRRRGREGSDERLREGLAQLLPLVRLPLVPTELVQQLSRRGVIPPSLVPPTTPATAVDAWLGRNGHPPPRCFLPYLDELKALLEDQAVPELELQRVRRARCVQPIPDTLYMVSSVYECSGAAGGGSAPLPARAVAALRARCAALCSQPAAQRALRLHADTSAVYTQIALRAVREVSLPDSCASLLLSGGGWGAEGGAGGRTEGPPAGRWAPLEQPDCCRSVPSQPGTLRRGAPSLLPDIALPPNANTHLLTSRDLLPSVSTAVPTVREPPLLQLDLGDGATHTPRPGSRAGRAAAGQAHALALAERLTQRRERARDRELPHTQVGLGLSLAGRCREGREGREAREGREVREARDEELRASIEMSLFRAYTPLQLQPAPASSLSLHRDSHIGGMEWGRRTAHPSHAHALRREPERDRDRTGQREHTDCRLEPGVRSYTSSANTSRNPSPSHYG